MDCLLNDLIITEEKEFDHPQAQKKFSVEWSTVKRLSKVVLQVMVQSNLSLQTPL